MGGRKVSGRLLTAGIIASILPDADAVGFLAGIPYSHPMGHRGFSHSIAVAFLLALCGLLLANWLRSGRITAFIIVFVSAMSHGLLDALTSGGLGVAFLSPFSNERFFFSWRSISVSPLSLERLMNSRGLMVLQSEFTWVWLPSISVGLLGFILKKVLPQLKPESGRDKTGGR